MKLKLFIICLLLLLQIIFCKKVILGASGAYHNIFIKDNYEIWTSGKNEFGQLGDGTTTDRSIPVRVHVEGSVLAGKKVSSLGAGYDHSLAICEGKAFAWGLNIKKIKKIKKI
jgi:alpha-tubulin suppressor-like RCC1 family protein